MLKKIGFVVAGISLLVSPLTVAASPVASTVCPQILRSLSRGSRGNDVMALQAYLGVSPTGYFGPLTASAVAQFQASEGLSQVGIVGPLTRAAFARRCGNPTLANDVVIKVPGQITLSVGQRAVRGTNAFGTVPDFSLNSIDAAGAHVTITTGYCETVSNGGVSKCPNPTSDVVLALDEPQFVGSEIYTLTSVSGNSATIREDTSESVIPKTPYDSQTIPALDSIVPSSGSVGSSISLNGSGFSSTTKLHFAGYTFSPGYNGLLMNAAGTQMTFTIPSQVFSCEADRAVAAPAGSDCAGSMINVLPGTFTVFLTQGWLTSTNLRSGDAIFTVIGQVPQSKIEIRAWPNDVYRSAHFSTVIEPPGGIGTAVCPDQTGNYTLDFGDGSSAPVQFSADCKIQFQEVDHVYTGPGPYTARLLSGATVLRNTTVSDSGAGRFFSGSTW